MNEINSIPKESLIKFIDINFEELSKGGCADYNNYLNKYPGMKLGDINACEKMISKLLNKRHNITYYPVERQY